MKRIMVIVRDDEQRPEVFARAAETLARACVGLALEGAEVMIVMGEDEDDEAL